MVELVEGLIGEEGQVMAETMADYMLKKGLEQGRIQGQRELLLSLISKRFPDRAQQEIASQLEAIRETERLAELSERLLGSGSWDDLWA